MNELDITYQRSLVNLVTPVFRSMIEKIPEELLNRKEADVIKLCYSEEPNGFPIPIDSVLRRNFWDEYNRVQADELPVMSMKNIYTGACSQQCFNEILHNPKRLAFIITEPNYDKVKSQYALDCVWTKIIALSQRDPEINTKTGLPDSKVWDLQLKLFQFLEEQIKGKAIQTIKQENKNTNTNTNVNVDANKAIEQLGTEAEIQKVLEELKSRLAQLPTPPQPQLQIEPKLVLPVEQSHRDAKKAEVER